MIRSGALDKRITIEQATRTRETVYGSEALTWSTFATVWAEVKEESSVERVRNDLRTLTRVSSVMIRYLPGLTAQMRIVLPDSRVMQIVSIHEVGRKIAWRMTVEEYSA